MQWQQLMFGILSTHCFDRYPSCSHFQSYFFLTRMSKQDMRFNWRDVVTSQPGMVPTNWLGRLQTWSDHWSCLTIRRRAPKSRFLNVLSEHCSSAQSGLKICWIQESGMPGTFFARHVFSENEGKWQNDRNFCEKWRKFLQKDRKCQKFPPLPKHIRCQAISLEGCAQQRWYLSKILHDQIFEPEILHTIFIHNETVQMH